MKASGAKGVIRSGRKTRPGKDAGCELVIITGLSGSGKGTVLKALEDAGFYAVDNLPLGLLTKFAELIRDSANNRRAALVVDIREGEELRKLPSLIESIRHEVPTKVVYLEADDATIVRRFSETRRPHPLGTDRSVAESLEFEHELLTPIRSLADVLINTTRLNVHELREVITEKFHRAGDQTRLRVGVTSFGYRHGVPPDSDLVFDVRFLPNPNYIAEYKPLTGLDPRVAHYIESFPQTQEFIHRIMDLLLYLIPHYIREGKSYLNLAFGCTGGQHRSVMIAEEIVKRLDRAGYHVKGSHRDMPA